MSQLLCRIAKLSSSSSSSSSQGLCFSELRRYSTAATPYLLLQDTIHRVTKTASGGVKEMVVDVNLYDPRQDKKVKIPDQTLSKGLELAVTIGSSRGWVGANRSDDPRVRLTNMFNPCASVSSHKVITLPPLDDPKLDHFACISLSASPNQQEEDCVVAAMSTRSTLSLCRPGDSHWTPIEIPSYYGSKVTYSERDQKFYLHVMRPREQEYEGPIDFIKASSGFPQLSLYQSFPNSHIPKSRRDQLFSTLDDQYLVESPSGDYFIVYWYSELWNLVEWESTRSKRPPYRISSYRRTSYRRRKPRGFVVFRQDPEQRIGSYTEDIGDLCIFLGWNEPFCVSATEYPGLNPNCVYYTDPDTGSGFYDLSSNTAHDFTDEPCFSSSYLWLAPLQQ